ncbi:cupin domain-containing protein [Amphiplicatus metriothermophilus]|uniref:Cupin domain-containing protein n=1 Tax=Amphiplicatus metriothermophilus TaxID=1519374 RepID=A0A239PKG2_9PROT|nr:cupin domain-containing protein [Amphiplicatus metriothermophilus]MBB5517367.1 mannose-6-phosphate isomerase-like protein (cupin superfamily) [Amphiplicatus metriothermophilus]SNT68298.1 Cupin domain-containing protein [Amphiplicatus metriothermophilus]
MTDGEIRKINIPAAFDRISEPWSPHVAARLNGQDVRLVKLEGAFDWHRHAGADEAFFVVKGAFAMGLREGGAEREIALGEGDLIVVPAGVEHRPRAETECWVMLFEPSETVNTGEKETARTKRDLPML